MDPIGKQEFKHCVRSSLFNLGMWELVKKDLGQFLGDWLSLL